MADQDHALSLIGKVAEYIHDLLLGIPVKIAGRNIRGKSRQKFANHYLRWL
jgi:hypothetical protein